MSVPNHYTFTNGQIAALRGIASISSIMTDYTYPVGRPYFTITYQAGAVVEVPSDLRSLGPTMTEDDVVAARAGFVGAAGWLRRGRGRGVSVSDYSALDLYAHQRHQAAKMVAYWRRIHQLANRHGISIPTTRRRLRIEAAKLSLRKLLNRRFKDHT